MAKKPVERGSLSRAIREFLSRHPESSPHAIQAGLKKQGIKVSTSLAASIKYRKTGKASRSKSAQTNGNSFPLAPPHADETGSRSRAIREYLAKKPKASPKEIVAALKKKGIRVSFALVGVVKQNVLDANSGRSAGALGLAGSAGHKGFSAEAIIDAKKLVEELGGIANARKALDLLEQLR